MVGRITLAKFLIQLTILFWLFYRPYFGFDKHEVSEAEKWCVFIAESTISIAVLIYLTPLLMIYERFVFLRSKEKCPCEDCQRKNDDDTNFGGGFGASAT